MTGKKDARRKRSGKIVRRTRLVESREKKYRRSTEINRILVVTTMGWTSRGGSGERGGGGRRE